MAFARPHDARGLPLAAQAVGHAGGRGSSSTFDERQQQAARALACLADLGRRSRASSTTCAACKTSVLAALYAPETERPRRWPCWPTWARAESQRALVELASRFTQPLDVRQAAAKAFRISTRKYGILLTTDEIRRQYDRYQRSQGLRTSTRNTCSR